MVVDDHSDTVSLWTKGTSHLFVIEEQFNNMSKKNKKSSQNHGQGQRFPVDVPYVIDMDALGYSSDDDLRERHGYLSSARDQVLRAGMDAYLWEVELAYLQREFGIRETRRAAHEKYLRLNPDETVMHDSHDGEFLTDSN